MDMLLKEMQDMDKFVQKPVPAPSVIHEVSKLKHQDQLWSGPKSDESLAEVRWHRTCFTVTFTFLYRFSFGSNH